MQLGLHCQQEPGGGSTLMKEQVWDTELFPKDPIEIDPCWLGWQKEIEELLIVFSIILKI